jgi:uncharacterized protein YciI
MLFLAQIENNPGMEDVRRANYDAHVDYLRNNIDVIRAAASLKPTPDGPTVGIVWIIEAASKADAEKACHGDPFYKAGLRRSISVLHFVKSVTDRTASI